MIARRSVLWPALSLVFVVACVDAAPGPRAGFEPSFAAGGVDRPSVLVNPNASGNGTAQTIQEGIDMVGEGGTVMIVPGTYAEAIVIDKGLTLEGIGGESGPVIIAPAGAPNIAVQVTTRDPVIIRNLTVTFSGAHGVRGDGVVDVTVESVSVFAVNPPLGLGRLISVFNNATVSGGRARLSVRQSFLDGSVPTADSPTPAFPQMFGVTVQGDIDSRLEGNTIRRTGGACIVVNTRTDFGGEVNADILDNDLDECYPLQRAGAILVQSPGLATAPITATGTVNIVGNTIRNTFGSCLVTTAISHIFARARIERNRILNVVQPCATPIATRNPGAIWIGSLNPITPGVSAVVRFNDIEGNAHAGLRIGPNITTAIDGSCNWWGSASGPSGAGLTGTGDARVVEPGATPPSVMPFAAAPIARTGATGC